MNIVSLLPSATEICFLLDLGDAVVGVSHECDHPASARSRPVLTHPKIDPTGTSAGIHAAVSELTGQGLSVYQIDEDRLRELAPDLIVTQNTCEVCAVSLEEVEEAARRIVGGDVEVLPLSPANLEDVLEDILRVGRATGREDGARSAVARLRGRLEALEERMRVPDPPTVLALEWLDPPMVAGHWTPRLLEIAGGRPLLGHPGRPTGPVEWEAITRADPDHLVLIPCGFKIDQTLRELDSLATRPGYRDMEAVRSGRVHVIDGNAFFNRPGPRLVDSAEIAARLLHPDLFPDAPPLSPQDGFTLKD